MADGLARILLVDDDPLVIRGLSRVLQRRYSVVGATDAQEALRRLETGEPIDLVISDVVMPGQESAEFLAAVRRVWPPAAERLVLLTGLVDLELTQELAEQLDGRLLHKPVEAQKLLALVDHILQPHPP